MARLYAFIFVCAALLGGCGGTGSLEPQAGGIGEERVQASVSHYRTGRYLEAAETAGRAIQSGGLPPLRLAVAHGVRGASLSRMRQYPQALTHLDAAIGLADSYAFAHYHRALTLWALRQDARALGAMDRAVGLAPGNHLYMATRGQIHASLRQYADAFKDLDRAVQLGRNEHDTFYLRGLLFELAGLYDAAQRDYDRAFRLDPANERYHAALKRIEQRSARRGPRPEAPRTLPVDRDNPIVRL